MFEVSENKVRARLQKFGLNKQRKQIMDASREALEIVRQKYIDEGREAEFEKHLVKVAHLLKNELDEDGI